MLNVRSSNSNLTQYDSLYIGCPYKNILQIFKSEIKLFATKLKILEISMS